MKIHEPTWVALVLVLSACGAGSGEGLDANGQPIIEDDTVEQPDAEPIKGRVTLAQIQDDIFSPICAQCHVGNAAPQGLRLDSLEQSYQSLVGVLSQEIPTLQRVAVGDPENSYILHKLEGRPSIVGSRMPLGQPALSDEQIQRLRDWIRDGAERGNEALSSTRLTFARRWVEENQWIAEFTADRALNAHSFSDADLSVAYFYGDQMIIEPNAALVVNSNRLVIKADIDTTLENPTGIRLSIVSMEDERGRYLDGDHDGLDGGTWQYEFINP